MKLNLEIKLLSPLHLGSGRGDIVRDAEIVHDENGIPYFPAKRVRGLLYESALELAEMSKYSGLELVNQKDVDELFGNIPSTTELFIHSLYVENYEKISAEWTYLLNKYPQVISSNDVLESYTSVRYQTKIDKETGVAAHGSLRNLRVVDADLKFSGTVEVVNEQDKFIKILQLAAANLHYAGAKRNRGFGEIECKFIGIDDKYSLDNLLGGK